MRILAFHSCEHDASAAAFDEYDLVAAVAEERMVRRKGWGDGVPWLAIDEVLRIAGWSRYDVDVIALGVGTFPTQYLRFELLRDLYYTARRWHGSERAKRDMLTVAYRSGVGDPAQLFRADRFRDENAFRADVKFHFANHHEAHALDALFFTDWPEALIYTADGLGDNVSYSIRTLQHGKLECHYGGEMMLTDSPRRNSIALAYAHATEACGFRPFRHEGKLTGISARGEARLAPQLAQHFRVGREGFVEADFKDFRALRAAMMEIFQGHDRETIAASVQKAMEDVMLNLVRHWIERSGARRLGLAGGLFANVRLNRLLAELLPLDEIFIFPAMGDDGVSVGLALSFLHRRDGTQTWLRRRRRLDDVYLGRNYDGAIDDTLRAGGMRQLPGAPVETVVDLIHAGKAGAIYTGRMEYGPRALGARSIIAARTTMRSTTT